MTARRPGSRIARTVPPPAPGGRAAGRVWPILVLGFAPPLAILAGVAAAAVGRAGDAPGALVWAVIPAAVAALFTAASAALTLAVLRRAPGAPAPEARPDSVPDPDPDPDAGHADRTGIEIDHKVRNALQIVESLISLELRRVGASGERAALLRVQARLHSLSLVHRRFSALDAPPTVRLDLIADEIADHLFADDLADDPTDAPQLSLEPVSAPPERGAAFALFVNEALMNARDHLRCGRAAGPVTMSLCRVEGGGALLSIRNPLDAIDDAAPGDGGTGARLMANCAEQLGAGLSAGRSGGHFEVRLEIPPEDPAVPSA